MSSMTFSVTMPDESAMLRPVPVLLIPCAFTNSNVFGPLRPALAKAGFFVASMDETPAVPLKQLEAELNEYCVSKLHVPPLIVAQGYGASLAQKYIESFGARGLVMLNPCAPDCASSIEASVPKSAGLSGDAFATAIRAGFGADSPESFVKRWMLSEGVSDTTLQSALASLRTGGINTSLLEELRDKPVNLEPAPVQMLAVGSTGDIFCPVDRDLKAVVNYHQLEPEEVHVVGAEGFGGVLGHAPGHLMLIEQADHEEQGSILDAVLQFACR